MPEQQESCVKPAGGPVAGAKPEAGSPSAQPMEKEEAVMTARVGREAPDFEATVFQDGGFKNMKLSDSRGKWIVLCFYPGDFTFV